MSAPTVRSHVGPWQQAGGWQSISQVARGDEVLIFDPPNVVFVNGGERVRVIDYDAPSPTFEVERIGGEVTRYKMVPLGSDREQAR